MVGFKVRQLPEWVWFAKIGPALKICVQKNESRRPASDKAPPEDHTVTLGKSHSQIIVPCEIWCALFQVAGS